VTCPAPRGRSRRPRRRRRSWPGVALHPNEAPRLAAEGRLDEALAEIERLAGSHAKVRAVGETGLDHFRTGPDGRPAQVESFARHIDLAKRLDKTLVIHDRDAHDEILDVIDAEGAPERWVMHCFSGNPRFARACLERGAWLSFAGTVTFKNAQPLRDALGIVPLDRVPGGDRRAVPDPHAVPRPPQRVVPRAR
jgi:TatD DNase family protein